MSEKLLKQQIVYVEYHMKVLFLGEFSGVFNELIPALNERDVETFLISDGCGYRACHADFYVKNESGRKPRIISAILRVLGIQGLFNFIRIWPQLKIKLSGYDVVQLNNDYPFRGFGWFIELYVLHYVTEHNKRIYLSAWGDDYIINKWLCRNDLYQYQFLSKWQKYKCYLSLLLRRKIVNTFITHKVSTICPGTYYYKLAYAKNQKTSEKIFPFAINRNKIGKPLQINPEKPIIIFHGWQVGREKEKGNVIFDQIIRKVVDKYGDKRVKYIVVKSVPYDEYFKLFSDAHIIIDQLYADDKGMSGLFGMAAGKVVFSGFMPEALSMYPYYRNNIVGIRSYNDEDYLFARFCELIETPTLMEEISRNAIDFVLHNHLDIVVAQQYITLWNSTNISNNI